MWSTGMSFLKKKDILFFTQESEEASELIVMLNVRLTKQQFSVEP